MLGVICGPLRVSQEYPKLCHIIVFEYPGARFIAAASARMIYARVNIICCSGRSHPSERSEALNLCLCLHVVSQSELEVMVYVTLCVTI
jgi:hypothetical protein